MANIPITHATLKTDYSGSGTVPANAELVAADWNQTHFTLSAGGGIAIVSDGGTPPVITFVVTGSSFGSLIPGADNTYDIGSFLLRWRNAYFAGAISAGANSTFTGPGIVQELPLNNAGKNILIGTPTGNAAIEFGTVGANTWVIDNSGGLFRIIQPGNVYAQFEIGTGHPTNNGATFTTGTVSTGNGFQTNAITPALDFGSSQAKIRVAGVNLLQFDTGTMFPVSDNSVALGGANNRFSNLILAGGLGVGFAAGIGAPAGGIINANSTISAGGGFKSSANVGYLGTGIPAFKFQAGGDSTKTVSMYHDGTTAVIQLVGSQTLNFSVPVNGLYDYSGGNAGFRFHGSGSQLATFSNNNYQAIFTTSLTPSGFYFGGHVSVGGHITPDVDNSFDIGVITGANGAIANDRWRNLYITTAMSIGAAFLFQDVPDGQFIERTSLGTLIWGVNSVNTLLHISTQFSPVNDNSVDLGDGAVPRRWRNTYVSGTVSAATGLVVTAGGLNVPGEGGITGIFLQNNARLYSVGGTSAFQMVDANPGKTIDWLFGLRSDLGPAADFVIYRNVGPGSKVWTNVAVSAGTSHQTNNSPALAVGGSAVDTGAGRAQVANLYIAVQVNGVTRYIPLFT